VKGQRGEGRTNCLKRLKAALFKVSALLEGGFGGKGGIGDIQKSIWETVVRQAFMWVWYTLDKRRSTGTLARKSLETRMGERGRGRHRGNKRGKELAEESKTTACLYRPGNKKKLRDLGSSAKGRENSIRSNSRRKIPQSVSHCKPKGRFGSLVVGTFGLKTGKGDPNT